MTDSGGLQKEAFFFSKCCITLRDETEWVELVEGGYNELAGAEESRILLAWEKMKSQKPDFGRDLYGKGHAARAIVQELIG